MTLKKTELMQYIETLAHTSVVDCYQCGKCTAGCPQGSAMRYGPQSIIQMVKRDQVIRAAQKDSIWQCLSCYTCTARCPKSVNITGIMDALKQFSIEKNIYSDRFKRTIMFQKAFLANIRRNGRTNELELVVSYKFRGFFNDFNPFSAIQDATLGPQQHLRT